jgi:ABC-type glutathione transport system ATPase component
MLLQFVANNEAMFSGIEWTSLSPVSGTPMYFFTVLLIVDVIMYSLLAAWMINFTQSTVPVKFHNSDRTVQEESQSTSSSICSFLSACFYPLYKCCVLTLFKLGIVQDHGLYSPVSSVDDLNARSIAGESTASSIKCDVDDHNVYLKVRELCKEYSTRVQPVSVLSNVSADLVAGEITSLLGSNGAGATTVLP